MSKKNFVYMKVTKDKYETPLIIADTADELAEKAGVDRTTIYRDIKKKGSGYVKVELLHDIDHSDFDNKLVKMGAEYLEKAKRELVTNGNTSHYRYLVGIAEGLRIALSVWFGKTVERIN